MQQSVRVRFCIGSLLQRRCKAIYKNSDLHTMQIAVFDCLSFLMRQAHHEEASIDFFLWVRHIVFALFASWNFISGRCSHTPAFANGPWR